MCLEESIKIPAILLSKTAGDRLIEVLRNPEKEISTVHAIYDFNLVRNREEIYESNKIRPRQIL